MDTTVNNRVAYIDAANLHKGVESLKWKLNYRKFRLWMRQKFGISEAFIFIGLIAKQANLYTSLQSEGYQLVFKDVVFDGDGKAKGNCDADLVLKTLAPIKKCSILLKRTGAPIIYLNEVSHKLSYISK